MCATLLVLCVLARFDGVEKSVPESLKKAYARREDFKTAYFQYEYRLNRPSALHSPLQRCEARFAGHDVNWTTFGDEDGIVSRDPRTCLPILGVAYACAPARFVRCNDEKDHWSIHDGEMRLLAKLDDPREMKIGGWSPGDLLDPRSAGLSTSVTSNHSPSRCIEELKGGDWVWSEKKVDGLLVVSASRDEKDQTNLTGTVTEWKIDPQRDDAIVEISVFGVNPDGSRKRIRHMEAAYGKFDGRWWPERCVFTLGMGVREEVTFTRVEFDRKQHPTKIGPDILGVPPGVPVTKVTPGPNGKYETMLGYYLGDGAVATSAEWQSTHKNKIDPAPLEAYQKKARSMGRGEYPNWWSAGLESLGLEGVSYSPDLWEAYVRRWIAKHSHQARRPGKPLETPELSQSQIEAAWAILKDCRKRAEPIVRRMEKEAPAAAEPGEKREKEDKEQPSRDGDQAGTTPPVRAPGRYDRELEKIFESLRARLDGLLTTKQEKAEANSDSRK